MVLLGWITLLFVAGLAASWRRRSVLGWMTLVAWVSLPVYNAALRRGCPGDCGIRVDLLVVVPVLLVLTVAWAGRQDR